MNYTVEQVRAMTSADELNAVVEELRTHQNDADFDVALGNGLLDAVEARKAELARAAESRAAFANRVANGQIGTPMSRQPGAETKPEQRGADSEEYRRAFLKNIAIREGISMFGEMSTEERSAFTFTTANSGNVVPSVMLNRIIELVDSEAPMYADAQRSSLTQGFSIPRHRAIVAGDAATTNEAVANDDEEDTFDLLNLAGEEIKKHLVISRKMQWKSLDAFGAWVEQHIADRISVAKENLILARLDNATYGIAAANVLANVAPTDAGIRGAMGQIHGNGRIVCYANNYTIWNILAGIDDGAGHKAFIPSPMSDPVTQGVMYGATVKRDGNLTNKVAYIGIPARILANNYEELFINHAIDPKTFADIIGGYSLFDAGLEDPLAFVKVTFQ